MREAHGASPIVAAPAAIPRAGRHRPIEDRANLVAAQADQAIVIPGLGIFLVGWLFDPLDRIARLRVRAGDRTIDVGVDALIRVPREDVTSSYRSWNDTVAGRPPGLAGLVPLPGVPDDVIATTLELELIDVVGRRWPVVPRQVLQASRDRLPAIREILSASDRLTRADLDRHVGPAVAALWVPPGRDMRVVDLGRPPEQPRISIVVPVRGRDDLIEYQVALFADDPDFHDVELIYVVDEPRIAERAERLCRAIHPIFRLPFRVVLNRDSRWLAGATNVGVELARGPVLSLLDARAMPAGKGWLSALADAHAQLPDDGLIGPSLLFLDGTIQSGGTQFIEDPPHSGIRVQNHAAEAPGSSDPGPLRDVAALSSACMMLSRGLYTELGGYDDGYLAGGFEGSDLCFRARQAGHGSHVAPWVRIFYLHRLPDGLAGYEDWQGPFRVYSAWRHTQRWGPVLDEIQGPMAHG